MDWSAQSDGELAAAFAASGMGGPFEQLIRRHSAMVYRTCRRITANHQDAEDAMQLVFAALAEHAHLLASYRSLGGWLYSTAWRTARHIQRTQTARRRRETYALRAGPTDLNGHPDEELLHELYRALEMLPPDYRDVIVLHHLEGMTVRQVADLLDCSDGTAASRLSRARAMIRERLSRRGLVLYSVALDALLMPRFDGEQSVPDVIIRRTTGAVAAHIPRAAVGSAGVAGATTFARAAAAIAGWSAFKYAVAASAAFVAVSAGAVAITHGIAKPSISFRMNGSASASATDQSAGKKVEQDDDVAVASAKSSAFSTAVPEPSLLPLVAIGMLALRRRRRTR